MPTVVRSNHHQRFFFFGADVPKKIMAVEFDWLDENMNPGGFIRYRGFWSHLSQYLRLAQTPGGLSQDWHGMESGSAFSGTVIRISPDGETYAIGQVFSVSCEDYQPTRGEKVYP